MPNIIDLQKTSREKNGLSLREVDGIIVELQKQMQVLKNQNSELHSAVSQYDDRVKQLESERAKESLRLSSLLNAAANTAEQIERDARQKAAEIISASKRETEQIAAAIRQEETKIIDSAKQQAKNLIDDAQRDADNLRGQAQMDYDKAREALMILGESVHAILKNNNQYMDNAQRFAEGANIQLLEIDHALKQALGVISEMPAKSAFSTASAPPASMYPTPPAVPDYTQQTNPAGMVKPGSNPYVDYVQQMKEVGIQPQYPYKDNK